MLVKGSQQVLWKLLEGWCREGAAATPALRKELESEPPGTHKTLALL